MNCSDTIFTTCDQCGTIIDHKDRFWESCFSITESTGELHRPSGLPVAKSLQCEPVLILCDACGSSLDDDVYKQHL